ncbi:MAG: hypothetical protein AVDCRST_MAG18-1555 [uncultured Thermomicrobiales bacterium]|uniref:Uncharacterized protein n=1 Tax=uncultured Thermomicrobiales bacterium TaxID=1645740 RepID=A0A6J4V5B9_9BACT|nr:MAG: hypothetical protein AVDCRST_MAG18-1555 [uncultured Thermomicrobiales bacterium]
MKRRATRYPKERYRASIMPRGTVIDPLTGTPAGAIRFVGSAEIKEALGRQNVRFALITFPQDTLDWVTPERLYETWKTELQPRVVQPHIVIKGFSLDDYPDGYCYVASEWKTADEQIIILFQMWH